MIIEKIKISAIVVNQNNVKEHTEEQIQQIINSIKEFGFNDPIAIDENNVIIEGHGRLEALKLLECKEVEVIKLKHLSKEQKIAYTIAHNKLTMNTGFDKELLKAELEKIENINFELIGFTEKEIKALSKIEKVQVDDIEIEKETVEFEIGKKKNGYICPECGVRHLKEKFEEVEI